MQNTLKKELVDKTRVVVTHAVQYLRHADKVLKVENGKIVFDGTYSELKKSEHFADIIKEQAGEDEGKPSNSSKTASAPRAPTSALQDNQTPSLQKNSPETRYKTWLGMKTWHKTHL